MSGQRDGRGAEPFGEDDCVLGEVARGVAVGPPASAVAALVDGDDEVIGGEHGDERVPFACVAHDPVQQHHGPAAGLPDDAVVVAPPVMDDGATIVDGARGCRGQGRRLGRAPLSAAPLGGGRAAACHGSIAAAAKTPWGS